MLHRLRVCRCTQICGWDEKEWEKPAPSRLCPPGLEWERCCATRCSWITSVPRDTDSALILLQGPWCWGECPEDVTCVVSTVLRWCWPPYATPILQCLLWYAHRLRWLVEKVIGLCIVHPAPLVRYSGTLLNPRGLLSCLSRAFQYVVILYVESATGVEQSGFLLVHTCWKATSDGSAL